MVKLHGLEGISVKEIDAEFIRSGKEIEAILNRNLAVTAAGSNGAINIWKDNDGWIRCEAMKYCSLVDKKIFNNIKDTIRWANKQLLDIGVVNNE